MTDRIGWHVNTGGIFISLDGIDGTGKSTQCRLLAQWLREQGYSVTECADPGGTVIGRQIRELLLDARHQMALACEMFLFMASRAQLCEEVIRPALQSGDIVISDRFVLANVVYQGHAGGMDPDQLWSIGKLATEGLLPDLTLVLDLPIDVAHQRRCGSADRMEERDSEYHQRVRDGFLREARRDPNRIKIIDALTPVDEVFQQICSQVNSWLVQKS